MSRKSVLVGLLIMLLVGSAVAAVLVVLVRHEPDMYQRMALPPGVERQHHSTEFTQNLSSLANKLLNEKFWEVKFTEAQINSYFDEDFIRSGVRDNLLPKGISQPRVAIDHDKLCLAFRYGQESWYSTVVTIDLRVWVARKTPEVNVVGLELQGLHAGSLPISAQSLLESVSDVARRQDIEVTWYRWNGNPVALLRFQATQQRPTVRLEHLTLEKGLLTIGGHSIEGSGSPLRAMLGGLSIPLPPALEE
jgi:hypothetical protein